MMIKIPLHFEDLYRKSIDKFYKLIKLRYWETIEEETLTLWLSNFESEEERYLAISILSTLIFRNQKCIESFGANIFHIILPQLLSDNSIYEIESIREWEKMLSSPNNKHLFPFRFSTIENIDGYPAKSGSIIYRKLYQTYFDKTLGINCEKIKDLPEKIKAIILFDDIVGTGEQFKTFYNKYHLDKLNKKIIYIPLAAHKKSIQKLNSEYHNVIIHPVEEINTSCEFFNKHNNFLNHEKALTKEIFLEFYLSFCKKKDIKLKGILGHGDMGLTYCFSDSTPNNNLILLSYKDQSWPGLLKR